MNLGDKAHSHGDGKAFVGGTGKYKGIEGEVTTTINDDATYVHVLDVKLEK